VNTLEHRRFAEFCDACRRYRYIGLCYGPSGVGKTLSAQRYSRWEEFKAADRWRADARARAALDTVFYTPSIVNSPGRIEADLSRSRDKLTDLARRPVRLEAEERLESIRRRDKQHAKKVLHTLDWFAEPIPEPQPAYGKVAREYAEKERRINDPTTLIVIDEADRLRMASLEQVRAIFDAQEIGLILIGMPGLEKRLARYPQFYSRIGFVHEFRPLGAPEIRNLLEQHWAPAGGAPASAIGPGNGRGDHSRHRRQLPVAQPTTDPNPADPRNQHPRGGEQIGGRGSPREPCDWTALTIAQRNVCVA